MILAQKKQTIGQSSALRSGEFLAVRFTVKCQYADNWHYPMNIATAEDKKKVMKRYKVYYKKEQIRRESRYTCDKCPSKRGLCIDKYFELYHTKCKYWK